MRAINHALTGTVIGLAISDPAIALPIAFLSHYVLDVIPHYGPNITEKRKIISSKLFTNLLIIDAILCFILVVVLFITKPHHYLVAIICAFLAALPDFFSFNRFYKTLKNKPWKPNLYSKFATKIQWFEKPPGILVEAVWFVAMIVLIKVIVKH